MINWVPIFIFSGVGCFIVFFGVRAWYGFGLRGGKKPNPKLRFYINMIGYAAATLTLAGMLLFR